MSSEARIVKVEIEYGDEGRVVRIPPDAGTPQSVKVFFADRSTAEVNADGGSLFTGADGHTVRVAADGTVDVQGEAHVEPRQAPSGSGWGTVNLGPGNQGVQIGPGNTQVNRW